MTNAMPLRPLIVVVGLCLVGPLNAADDDGDGIDDLADNCLEHANPSQLDSDGDGFGNRCDADLDGSGFVNFADLARFKSAFGTADPDADFDGSGFVNFADLAIIKSLFGKPPGPAGSGPLFDANAASRFLAQATFGPTSADIQTLLNLGSYDAWITNQFQRPVSLLLPGAKSIYHAWQQECVADAPSWGCPQSLNEVLNAGADGHFDTGDDQFRHVWWWNVIDGNDQLRQRVAFALSQIFVVSDIPSELDSSSFAVADYYDTLSRNAFGNFRELLEDVALHAVMGIYLSHAQNEKADPVRNVRPDENFARELLQLLTIGVNELNQDGTPVLDGQGQPIPAYGQFEVQEFARVFTGWSFDGIEWWNWHQRSDKTKPMVAFEEYHDTGEKELLDGVTLPAGRSTRQDLEAALDNVFNHDNVGPFFGTLLIKRLVTSNPTPQYVGRVAAAFNDNGAGVRGDMKAVIRAILLDPEARSGHLSVPGFGKLREPLLRITHLWRAFDAARINGGHWDVPESVAVYSSPGVWFGLKHFEDDIGQNVLRSPSVFNFFLPTHSPAGPVRDAGLVAPEFQIATEANVMGIVNTINRHIQDFDPGENRTYLRVNPELALVGNPIDLVDHLDLILTAGALSSAVKSIILDHLNNSNFQNNNTDLRKVRDAISLIMSSPEYVVQK
ncbi:MAG: DUF1800 family protein [Pseudomonadota bacterium]